MIRPTVSAPRATWLLVRLRVLRALHMVTMLRRSARPRSGTPGKGSSMIFTLYLALIMPLSFGVMSYQSIHVVRRDFGPGPDIGGVFLLPREMINVLLVQIILRLWVAFLVPLGSRELATSDWDLEWLATLPLPLPVLMASRIVERAVVNPMGVLMLGTYLIAVAAQSFGWAVSIATGVVLCILLQLICATAQTLIDTGLRLRLAPPQLRNLAALTTIGAAVSVYLPLSMSTGSASLLVEWSRSLGSWTLWTPPGLVLQALTHVDLTARLQLTGLLAAQCLAIVALGVAALSRMLKNGVVATAGRESVRGGPKIPSAHPQSVFASARVAPIVRKELRLLVRDRAFMTQTLLLPVLVIGGQFFVGRQGNGVWSAHGPRLAALLAFGAAAYTLIFSAFQALAAEGGSVWLLFSVPYDLARLLRQKTLLWVGVSFVYASVIFVSGTWGAWSVETLGFAALVLLGVPIYAVIAASLGVFASNPLAVDVRGRIKVSYTQLYMVLMALYAYAIYSNSTWQRLTFVILSALLAAALWQRATDHLPFLLDPVAAPPARVSVSDGLMAAMFHFVAMGVTFAICMVAHVPAGRGTLIAFGTAGVITFSTVRFLYWRQGTVGIPRLVAGSFDTLLTSIGVGPVAGCFAAAGAFVYLHTAERLPSLAEDLHASDGLGGSLPRWLILLTVVAAPLCEEFIFRGLIFAGLRRSMNFPLAALGSAAIFAIIHPPLSVLPVFGLGLCAACAYELSGGLLAPILAHAIYNCLVLTLNVLR